MVRVVLSVAGTTDDGFVVASTGGAVWWKGVRGTGRWSGEGCVFRNGVRNHVLFRNENRQKNQDGRVVERATWRENVFSVFRGDVRGGLVSSRRVTFVVTARTWP